MRHLARHLTYANAMATVAVFVALGGATYAATGDPFVLGQANSASKPTRLASGSADTALKATNSKTGRAIAGFAENQAIYGHSNSNAGLVGESESFDGVYGVSNGLGAGVSGHNDAGGFGLWASGGSSANNTAAVHGQSAAGNALEGFSTANPASGVYGQDDNAASYGVAGHSDNGVAVVGDSSSGWAFQALGHATQSRDKSGFVKAMAFVDPVNHPTDPVRHCFNSQRADPTGGNCGIGYSNPNAGEVVLDFNFQVDDRFVSVTGFYPTIGDLVAQPLANPNDSMRVFSGNNQGTSENSPFWIIVF